jgi:ketopantoate reductase
MQIINYFYMTNNMKITIIVSGGVGRYFGGKIAKAGYDVTFS